MEQFSLEKYLENPQRKVVTRQGRPVRIICTDRKHTQTWPIVALESYDSGEFVLYADDKGRTDLANENIHDLFFADEEEELTEFEKTMIQFSHERNALIQFEHTEGERNTHLHKYSKKLLDLARKELGLVDNTCGEYALNEAYKQGKQDALKDLPKWKRAIENKEFEKHVCVMDYYMSPFLDTEVNEGDYYIELSDLKNLPKEE